jgi:hypothetical protein
MDRVELQLLAALVTPAGDDGAVADFGDGDGGNEDLVASHEPHLRLEAGAPTSTDGRAEDAGVDEDPHDSSAAANASSSSSESSSINSASIESSTGATSHPTVCGAPVEALPVPTSQDRAFVSLADGQVDRPSGAWNERDRGRLVPLAGDPRDPMATLNRQVLDVGPARLADPQPVQGRPSGAGGQRQHGAMSRLIHFNGPPGVGKSSLALSGECAGSSPPVVAGERGEDAIVVQPVRVDGGAGVQTPAALMVAEPAAGFLDEDRRRGVIPDVPAEPSTSQ